MEALRDSIYIVLYTIYYFIHISAYEVSLDEGGSSGYIEKGGRLSSRDWGVDQGPEVGGPTLL